MATTKDDIRGLADSDWARIAIIDCLLSLGIPVRRIASLCHVRNSLITIRRAALQTPSAWEFRRRQDAPSLIADYQAGVLWDDLEKRYGGRNRVSKILREAGFSHLRGRGNHNPRSVKGEALFFSLMQGKRFQ